MKSALIKAYRELKEESPTLYGEELIENRERRKRMNLRSLRQYGVSISNL